MNFLMEAYKRGFIPGENEDETSFRRRVNNSPSSSKFLLYDMQVDWVDIRVGSDVRFWEGGYTAFENDTVLIVLPRRISSLLDFDELLQHELIHAVRSGFHNSRYEELIAYQVSKRGYRRFLGPLFESRWSAWFFILVAFAGAVASPAFYGAFAIPFLWYLPKMRRFTKAVKRIQSLFHDNPIAAVLSFSDEDIEYFATNSLNSCKKYVLNNNSIRFQQLRLSRNFK